MESELNSFGISTQLAKGSRTRSKNRKKPERRMKCVLTDLTWILSIVLTQSLLSAVAVAQLLSHACAGIPD